MIDKLLLDGDGFYRAFLCVYCMRVYVLCKETQLKEVSIFQNEKSTTPVPKSITPTSSGGSTPGSSGIKSLPKAPPLGKFNI